MKLGDLIGTLDPALEVEIMEISDEYKEKGYWVLRDTLPIWIKKDMSIVKILIVKRTQEETTDNGTLPSVPESL